MGDESGNLPARQEPLDRAALERVLARAAELQASARDTSEPTISEQQLIEIGREVGLSPENLRQALAEERTRVELPEETGSMSRLFGPAHVHASRVIPGQPAAVLDTLDEWMQREELLQVKRRFGDRILWERRSGFLSEMQRGLNVGGRGYHLAKANEVAATALAIDPDRVLVRLDADAGNVRTQFVAGGAALTGGGAAGAAILLALGIFPLVALAPLGAAAIGGWAIARAYTPSAVRIQLALEQVLDRLERGETRRPPSIISALTSTPRLWR